MAQSETSPLGELSQFAHLSTLIAYRSFHLQEETHLREALQVLPLVFSHGRRLPQSSNSAAEPGPAKVLDYVIACGGGDRLGLTGGVGDSV